MPSIGHSNPITSLDQLDPEGFYTYTDYLNWQFQERVELIKGKLMRISPAPNVNHQRVAIKLLVALELYLRGKSCEVFIAPFDVRLPVSLKKGVPTTVVQPDLCVVCDPAKLDEQGCNGAPDLVIEVLSPGNPQREMRDKFQVYEEAGVREYWLVDLSAQTVWVYLLNENGRFIGLAPRLADETLLAETLPGFEIDLGKVFGG
jgi:Uma2 family endonuclease